MARIVQLDYKAINRKCKVLRIAFSGCDDEIKQGIIIYFGVAPPGT
jgi:hypothetical protein